MTNTKLLTALMAVVLAGCQAAGSPSASGAGSPSAGASASSGSSASESVAASPSEPSGPVETIARSTTNGILPPDSIAIVMVDSLRVREGPSLDATILGSLDTGARVQVLGNPTSLSPVTADGHDWYLIIQGADEALVGWAAAGDPASPFLATLKPRCERAADLTLTAYEHLACHGNGSLTLEGTYGCGGCGGATVGTFTPEWLAHPLNGHYILTAHAGQGIGRIDMHLPPDGGTAPSVEGSILRVIGHFDDPAAQTCAMNPGEPGAEVPADPRAAVLYCRERFVIDSYETIGTDPSFQPG